MVAGRHMKFTAVLVGVVLSLTGFSAHGRHGGGSGGHGCSSGKSSHSSTYDSNNSNNSSNSSTGSGSGTGKSTKSDPLAHATVVSCAAPGRAKAVLQVTSDLDTQRTVDVPLTFEGNAGTVDRTSVRVTLKPRETQTVTVPMPDPTKANAVQRCQVGRIS
ncbi:hypothetical protein ACGFY6_09310 [Streptomyces sp. NPDC048387]|uniref:hypothetical protein n=1 Tax=Streptomyces sp. NPDC048387 TaxID=3365542 RepID=UPI00371E143E